jgi:hypothetical protein
MDSQTEFPKIDPVVRKALSDKYGDRRDVPQLFDEWKLANVPSVPGL